MHKNAEKRMKNVQEIVDAGYCSGCGVCGSICPTDAISINMNSYGEFAPFVEESECSDCGMCLRVCPFSDISQNEDEIAGRFYSTEEEIKHNEFIGFYKKTYIAHSNDEKIRLNSASGGVATQILTYLVEENIVDYVSLVLPNGNAGDDLFSYRLVSSADDVLKGSGSVYYPVNANQVINEIIDLPPSRIAFVGLPCTIKALRNAMGSLPGKFKGKDIFFLGLTCGGMRSKFFTEFLLKKNSKNLHELTEVHYRVKSELRKSNNFGVYFTWFDQLNNSKQTDLKWQDNVAEYWDNDFFKLNACTYCDDIFSETADICLMDAWLPEYLDDWKGNNLVVSRSSQSETFLGDLKADELLAIEKIEVEKVISSQRGVIKNKREGLQYRLHKLSRRASWFPKKRVQPQKTGNMKDRLSWDYHAEVQKVTRKYYGMDQDLRSLDSQINNLRKKLGLRTKLVQVYSYARSLGSTAKHIITKRMTLPLIYLILPIVRLYRFFMFSSKPGIKDQKSCLVQPPASPGSLGDEAIEIALVDKLILIGFSPIGIISFSTNDDWSHLSSDIEIETAGIFPNLYSFIDILRFVKSLIPYNFYFVLGTDVLDGGYSIKESIFRIETGKIAAKLGLKTSFISFSINDHLPGEIIKKFKSLPRNVRLISRDPISQKRLSGSICRKVGLSADIAFLLQENEQSSHVTEICCWVNQQKLSGRLVLGVNVNAQVLGKNNNYEQREVLLNAYVKSMHYLLSIENVSFLLLPHDFRGSFSDQYMSNLLIKKLSPASKDYCYNPEVSYNSREVKAVCKELDVIITGRMHLAIHGLGQCVPVACITYQDKFEGLMGHYKLTGLTISSSDACDPSKLSNFISKIVSQKNEIKAELEIKNSVIKELAQQNVSS